MDIKPINNTSFGILQEVKKRPYGLYMKGFYKGQKIEVYDAYKYNQFLIYLSDEFGNFIKSKLIYLQDGLKKVTKSGG